MLGVVLVLSQTNSVYTNLHCLLVNIRKHAPEVDVPRSMKKDGIVVLSPKQSHAKGVA